MDTATGVEWGNYQPDELSHVYVVRDMAESLALPAYDSNHYISVHPPLYHALAALAYRFARADLGYNGAMTLVRLLTALCGVGIVYLTYRAATHLAPPSSALLAGAFAALVPMRASLGGAISNENLAALGAAGVLATIVEGACDEIGFSKRQISLLALYLCVGIGSKVTCLGLLPVAGLALFWKARSVGAPSVLALRQFLALCFAVCTCWGWWFVRNQVMFGDPLRNAAADRLWRVPEAPVFVQAHRTALRYLLGVGWTTWRSFWGMFDGMKRPMPTWIYVFIAGAQVVSAGGLLREGNKCRIAGGRIISFASFTLFAAIVFVFFCVYNVRHYAAQGRYLFVLLLPFGLLMAIGWEAALPLQQRKWMTPALLTFLALVNLYALYVVPRRLEYNPIIPPMPWHPNPQPRKLSANDEMRAFCEYVGAASPHIVRRQNDASDAAPNRAKRLSVAMITNQIWDQTMTLFFRANVDSGMFPRQFRLKGTLDAL